MSKLEKKFGKYAIKNITLALILCYGAGYLISMMNLDFLLYLTLDPYSILRGQVWRLITWVIVPPNLGPPTFMTLLSLYFYFSIGTTMERTWGTWRYNVYLISGMLYTIAGAFILMGIAQIFTIPDYDPFTASLFFSTYYVNMSIFLAYAATYPEMRVLLFFTFPVKVKVLGIIYGIIIGCYFLIGTVTIRVAILASLMNFLIFFLTSRTWFRSPRQMQRKKAYRQEVKKTVHIPRHKCAVCGVTETQDPEREFRFCSKCEGNYEYCDRHLYTHEHVKK